MYTTRMGSALVGSPSKDRLDMAAVRPASTGCSGEVGAVEVLCLACESKLNPLRVLLELRSLRSLLILMVSEGRVMVDAGAEWV